MAICKLSGRGNSVLQREDEASGAVKVAISRLANSIRLSQPPDRPAQGDQNHLPMFRISMDLKPAARPQTMENHMITERQLRPRLAIAANARSAASTEEQELIKLGLVCSAPDGWLSITEKGRAMLQAGGYRFTGRSGWAPSGQAAERPFHFVRKHTPNSAISHGDFNSTHDACWDDENWRTTDLKLLLNSAFALVRRWNAQRPENTIWHYELAYGPAEALKPA